MQPPKFKFNFDYKLEVRISKLTPKELVQYRKDLLIQSKKLLAEASEWKYTWERVSLEMRNRIDELQFMELQTEVDRLEGDEVDYDYLCRIH